MRVALLSLAMLVAAGPVAGEVPYARCFQLAAQTHELPVALLHAVAAIESNYDADAVSHANAHGVMQIQWPGTARHLGVRRIAELYNPCLNIDLGARYLRELLEQHDGDLQRTLAAYNYGPTRIATSAELPAGAERYATRVLESRDRLNAKAAPVAAKLSTTSVTFASSSRAQRFAQSLNARMETARFLVSRTADGQYAVALNDSKLSYGDALTLAALGWKEKP